MTYRGRVHKNTIILPPEAALPEGTEVLIQPVADSVGESKGAAEGIEEFIGCLDGLPEDFADNHDHYIHGAPKRHS